MEQLHKIFKLCGSPSEEYWKKSKLPHATIFKPQQSYKRCIAETFKDFPPSSLPLIDTLLAIDPAERQTATAALMSEVRLTFIFLSCQSSVTILSLDCTMAACFSYISNANEATSVFTKFIYDFSSFAVFYYQTLCL